mgnify:CR=1 FL=1
MKEGFPQSNESQENEQLLRDAEHVINAMWNKAMDVNDLPLSVDLSYQAWSEDLERRKNDFARVLFNKARESAGEEKFRSARTLKLLFKLLGDSDRQEILKELMTTDETVQELVQSAEEQGGLEQAKPEHIKGKVRKAIDPILMRDDDFHKRLK